ncbi:glutamate racemase [Dechloromonas hortensis]|uniref:glutamate racemase n=1 Tax=Dechloromonas hortensis TaxID=337779 RepID=UPI001290FFD4|nr:glutamate racemase [Dechloromonas hortensis]
MPLNNQPIAVFDSGLGGLTVLRALRDRLPQEDFFYFADTRFLPYGDRPETFLKERGVLIAEALARRGAKALVIACNTATAAAAEAIRAASSLPIVALEPGVKPAASLTRSGVIGVLATTRTLQSERFQRLVGNHANHLRVVAQACPGLAETIEEQGPHSAQVLALLDGFVTPLAAAGADVVVLGCTHYPWVAEAIAARMPAGVSLLDTGEPVARQLERLLGAKDLLGGGHGHLQIATSGAPARVIATVDRLWGQKLPVEHWEP